MFIVSPKFNLRRVREENALLVTAVNEYKMRGNSLEKKMDEKKLNKMSLLQELKQSNQVMKRLEWGIKRLRQATERVQDIAFRKACISLMYVQRLLVVLKPQSVGMVVGARQSFGAWLYKGVPDLSYFIVRNVGVSSADRGRM